MRPSEWPCSTIFFISGNFRSSTIGLPVSSCQEQPPALQFGQVGRAGSAVGGLPKEQLQRCQPSSMLIQSKPSDASVVGFPARGRG